MSLLERYLEFVVAKDAEKVASLFSEDGVFCDEGPIKLGMDPVSLKGRGAIRAFFEDAFSRPDPIEIFNVNINGSAMRYDVKIGDVLFLPLGVMREENDEIKEFKVTAL